MQKTVYNEKSDTIIACALRMSNVVITQIYSPQPYDHKVLQKLIKMDALARFSKGLNH